MAVTLRRRILMAWVLAPSLSWPLGLGELHLKSGLNEPMVAEIDLVAATAEELSALHATLGSREAFSRYGIERPQYLSSLSFKVEKNKDGGDVLVARSTDPIPEPFVTFIVEATWARGRLTREYTVLLDPMPGSGGPGSAAAAAAGSAPSGVESPPASA
ncbi:MAG: peptidoglycan-binding protein, partial [Pseudomonadota bacterium]|nr:peptidoglycan-binding protein [Pseudomonadota bacterium]